MTGREPDLRVLQPGDETALDAFLVDHTDTSMFLRANARLVVPRPVLGGELRVRHPATAELALLVSWRVSFAVEALGTPETTELRRVSQADIRLQHERGADWVLAAGDTLVAYAAFNAMLPEIVQIGGVWTPPAARGRGYARSVVARAPLAASQHGVRPARLFAAPPNAAAR